MQSALGKYSPVVADWGWPRNLFSQTITSDWSSKIFLTKYQDHFLKVSLWGHPTIEQLTSSDVAYTLRNRSPHKRCFGSAPASSTEGSTRFHRSAITVLGAPNRPAMRRSLLLLLFHTLLSGHQMVTRMISSMISASILARGVVAILLVLSAYALVLVTAILLLCTPRSSSTSTSWPQYNINAG